MQQDASSQTKIPVQQRSVSWVVLLLIFILFINAVLPVSLRLLSSSSSPLCSKSWINPCRVTWHPWWFIISTGFAQPSHQWHPSNANPPCASFPLRHLGLLHFPYLFSDNSFLPYNLLKGLRTFSLFLTSIECVKKREWAQKAMGTAKCFWNRWFFSPPALSLSWPVSVRNAGSVQQNWPLHLFSRQ